MSDCRDMAQEIRDTFSELIGQRLVRSRNFLATRHFCFGQSAADPAESLYTLGVECPWRIRRDHTIVAGSEDYCEMAETKTGESWDAGDSGGRLQNQQLAELLGELKEDGSIINTGAQLAVELVDADECGGFRIGLTEACALEAFPASAGQMEWIIMLPGNRALTLMNGVLSRTTARERRAKGK